MTVINPNHTEAMSDMLTRSVATDRWLLKGELGNSFPDDPAGARSDWQRDHALKLVEDACAALHAKELEVQALRSENWALQAQLRLAQDEIRRSYDDAARANKRASLAEAWLARISAAVKGIGRGADFGSI